MTFPKNARTGQTHKKYGRRYAYSETTDTWTPIVPLASKAEIKRAQASAAGATTVYATAVELPLSNNTTGELAFVQETDRLYVWSGTGWYNIATISAAGASISGANATYTLATDGTPTVVTLTQTGLTSPTWSYEVTSGSIGRTAVVTQVANVFTITPSTLAKNVGSFGITFKATDGSNTIVKTSQFSMSNTAPVIGTAPNATYTLAEDGTPTVITLAATDADGHDITWSYEVLSGSLGGTTVSIDGSEFTITPSTDTGDAGTFQLRFIASDGASFDADVSEFALAFGPDWTSISEQQKIVASDKGTGNSFGEVGSIDGSTIIIGAPRDNDNGVNSGSVYILTRSETTWVEHQKIVPTTVYANHYFGTSVAISGDTAIVGAIGDHVGGGTDAGAAYIFNRSGDTWAEQQRIKASDAASGDSFGYRVAIDGDTCVISAYGEDAIGSDSGSVYIFTRSGTTWTQQQKIVSSDIAPGDRFGSSVAIDGDTVIVGARFEGLGGSAYIFTRSGTTWTQQQKIVSSDLASGDSFGSTLAIEGDTAIVGASSQDTGGLGAGAAYIFTRSGTTWSEQQKIQASDAQASAAFGYAVCIQGDVIAVGSRLDSELATSSGAAYIFTRNGATWTQRAKIKASDAAVNDYFSAGCLDISGETVIVGSGREDTSPTTDNGALYIFTAPT